MKQINTRLEAYRDVIEDGTVDSQCDLIVKTMKHVKTPLSMGDIARIIKLPPGRVSARFSTLRKRGLVKEYGYKVDPHTKKTVTAWTLTSK